jgi:hypothetical protein
LEKSLKIAIFSRFHALPLSGGEQLSDSVAVDAKRILLRYGAPINVLDEVSDEDRIALARAIAKTTLADRETRLKELLAEQGYGS